MEIKKAKLISNSIKTVNPNPHYKEVVKDGIAYVETYGYNGPKSEYIKEMLAFDGQPMAMTPVIKLTYIDPEEAKSMTPEEIKVRANSGYVSTNRSGTNCSMEVSPTGTLNQFNITLKMWSSSANWWNHFSHFQGYVLGGSQNIVGGYYNYGNGLPVFLAGSERVQSTTFTIGGNTNVYGCSGCAECNKGWGYDDGHVDSHLNDGWWSDGVSWAATSAIDMSYTNPVVTPGPPWVSFSFDKNSPTKNFSTGLGDIQTWCYFNDNDSNNIVNNTCNFVFYTDTDAYSVRFRMQFWGDGQFNDWWAGVYGMTPCTTDATFNNWLRCTPSTHYDQRVTFNVLDAEKTAWRVACEVSSVTDGQIGENMNSCGWQYFSINRVPTMDETKISITRIDPPATNPSDSFRITPDQFELTWEQSSDPKDMQTRRYQTIHRTKIHGGEYGDFGNNIITLDDNSTSKIFSMHDLGVPENYWINFGMRPGDELEWNYGTWYWNNLVELHNTPPTLTNSITADADSTNKYFIGNIVFTLPKITDKENDLQTVTYQIQQSINDGAWQDVDMNYASSNTTITIDANAAVGGAYGATFKIKVTAFDGLEYSNEVISSVYTRNIPPQGTMTITYHPSAHLTTHNEYIDYIDWTHLKDTSTGKNCVKYEVALYNGTSNNPAAVLTSSTINNSNKWSQGIENVSRGNYFKYGVIAVDRFGEKSVENFGSVLMRNRMPAAPGAPTHTENAKELYTKVDNTITWTASTDADGDKVTYELQYKTNTKNWTNIVVGLSSPTYVLNINKLINDSDKKMTLRVRAKDEHDVYSDWNANSFEFTIIRYPATVSISLSFAKNVSKKFGSNAFNTYCFYNDVNAPNVVNNVGSITFNMGKYTQSARFILQYYNGSAWVDDTRKLSGNLKANFNSWFPIGEGSNIQTVTFTKPDAARSKWRVKLEASAVTTDQKFENMSETTEIEFAVNSLPTMEATTLKISPITVAGSSVTNITTDKIDLNWGQSTDAKDMTIRKYRLRFRTRTDAGTYGNYSSKYIDCPNNSTTMPLSLHDIGVPENSWIEFNIQPGDDLDYDWETWYANSAEELHNTPPKLIGKITSDQDAYHKFRDNITFTLPSISDPQSKKQTLTYDVEKKIGTGAWTSHQIGLTTGTITIDAGAEVKDVYGTNFAIRVRAFDGMEYSDWVESSTYQRSKPPQEVITVNISPAAHKNTHSEYVDYCYWNSIKDNTTGNPIAKYNVWLYNEAGTIVFDSVITGALNWHQDIKDAANPDDKHIARGKKFKYAVQAVDYFEETSPVYYSTEYLRNRAPSAPASITIPSPTKMFYNTTITWKASTDPDTDSITYELQFSADNATWKDLGAEISGTSYTHVIGDLVDGSHNTCYYRVRAKDEHGVYSAWTVSSAITVDSAPDVPTVTLRFEKNTPMAFNGVNTYPFFNDTNLNNVVQNMCTITYTPGNHTFNSRFRLQHMSGSNWVDDNTRTVSGVGGKFNQWNAFKSGTSVQTTTFSVDESKITKWRVWMECCSVAGANSKELNTSASSMIEFSVNFVPTMDGTLNYSIPYPTTDGKNNITDDNATLSWNASIDNKDINTRKYRMRYRIGTSPTSFNAWNSGYISCANNATQTVVSMHKLAINENVYVDFQIQPGDDLDWNYNGWCGTTCVVMHNTAPRLNGRITSNLDTHYKFKDNIDFTLPTIVDPQSNRQNVVYEIQTKVGSGAWTNYDNAYTSNKITIDAGKLVGATSYGEKFAIRVRAFDQIEYSDWVESNEYTRNTPPTETITVKIYPEAHAGTHSEYVDYCYWNSIKDNSINAPISKYNVWLYKDGVATPVFQDVVNTVNWHQDIKNAADPDNGYIARGQSFKYAVQAVDTFEETSPVYYSDVYMRNRAPSAPASITVPSPTKMFYDTTINWAASTDQDGDLLTYELQFSTDKTNWTTLSDTLTTNKYTHVIGDLVDGSHNTCYYRVRAKDEHEVYSAWTTSTAITVDSSPDKPDVSLRFEKNTPMAFNGVDTYPFFNDSNLNRVVQNMCTIIYTPGNHSASSNFKLQYYSGGKWVNESTRTVAGVGGKFNQWNAFASGASIQTTYFSTDESKISKWRVWMECCSVNGVKSNEWNTSTSDIIEFSVNLVPTMDNTLSYSIPYPTKDGKNNITDDNATLSWSASIDNKDINVRKYRLKYRIDGGAWSTDYIDCANNSTSDQISMHNMGIGEGNGIELQIQPGDDLDWNYQYWYGSANIIHNTPPKLSGAITSDMDEYHKFKDNIEFHLPKIEDPQANNQNVVYEIQTKVGNGAWTNYDNAYVSDTITINAGTLVKDVYGTNFVIRVRAFDQIEYSNWVESSNYIRNTPPQETITVNIHPEAHKGTHSEYVEYCYWNSVKDNTTNAPIKKYNVWLYNGTKVVFQDIDNGTLKWYQDIKDYANEDTAYIPRGQKFKYAVQAVDYFEETSPVFYSSEYSRNSAPTAPTNLVVPSPTQTYGNTTIKWKASSDPDADSFTYEIEFSPTNQTSWIYVIDGLTTTQYTHKLGDIVDGSVREGYYRVRAKDEHGVCSPWTVSSKIILIAKPDPPKVTLRFEKGNSMAFKGVETYPYFNDADISNVVQNMCTMTFTPGNYTFSSNFRLQYYSGGAWVDEHRTLQNVTGTFNSWNSFKSGTSIQTTKFSIPDSQYTKWRVWMQGCSIDGKLSDANNTADSDIIEFSVNFVPTMDDVLNYKIPYPTLDGLNNITDDLAELSWHNSVDNKDIVTRKFRLRYRIETTPGKFSDWSTDYIACPNNSLSTNISMHTLGINENSNIELQVQPGDDLDWNYDFWYGSAEVMHNTPPKLSGRITSDMDTYHKFKDMIEFSLPTIVDPQDYNQKVVYDIQTKVDGGTWTDYMLGYVNDTITIDGNKLVGGKGGSKLTIRVRAFDQIEYSSWVESSVYTRNTPPQDTINVKIYPVAHNNTHSEYVDYCYWNSIRDTATNTLIKKYNVWLYNTKNMTTPVFQDLVEGGLEWHQDIKDYLNEDTKHIPRGESFKYAVQAIDYFEETSPVYYSEVYIRNRAPSAPAKITIPEPVKTYADTTISWTASTDADKDLLVYELQFSPDMVNWTPLIEDSTEIQYTHVIGDIVDGSVNECYYRVRAKDEHDVYSPWTVSSKIKLNSAPGVPKVTLRFDKNVSMQFKGVDTYCYFDDSDLSKVTQNLCTMTFSPGDNAVSSNFRLQYFQGGHWVDDYSRTLQRAAGTFNEWNSFNSGTSVQTTHFSVSDSEYTKWRVWMECCSVDGIHANANNTSTSNIIEFSVNFVPTMNDTLNYKIPYPTLDGLNNITDDLAALSWTASIDNKDITTRKYRLRYRIQNSAGTFGNWSDTYILCNNNSIKHDVSMHTLGINENTEVEFQIQPGDDLDWNYDFWYGSVVIMHNTPPKLNGTITSDMDAYRKFKDMIEFSLPQIVDPQDYNQNVVYEIQTKVDIGSWTDYMKEYTLDTITIDAGKLTGNNYGSSFIIRIRAFDQIEYSPWLESNTYVRNTPPGDTINVRIYPAAHKNTHSEYVDYCYWNSIKDNSTNSPIKKYNVWLYNTKNMTAPVFQDLIEGSLEWPQDIKDYLNEDTKYIPRGESFKYAVQAIDHFEETSPVYYSNEYKRNSAPSTPINFVITPTPIRTYNDITVSWTASADADADSLVYELQFSSNKVDWIDVVIGLDDTTYTHKLGDLVDGSVNEGYYRVRAKDEHDVYSAWLVSSKLEINSAPGKPEITLRFNKNVSMQFNSIDTYCFYDDTNIYNVIQNLCTMTFTPGHDTYNSNFRLQYFQGGRWVDDYSRTLQHIGGSFNEWNTFTTGTSTQTTYFSDLESEYTKWRVWMECCSVEGIHSNSKNTSTSDIIEFSVNKVPVMDGIFNYKIPYPTLDGLNNITDNKVELSWNPSTDNKDMTVRRYRIRYRVETTPGNFGNWSNAFIDCVDNTTKIVVSMHDMAINENTNIELQLQPGDDLEWNWGIWYGSVVVMHNTPPRLDGVITSDQDNDYVFKDFVTFDLPTIIDPQDYNQNLEYYVYVKVGSQDYKLNTVLPYNAGNQFMVDCNALVGGVEGEKLRIMVKAFDQIEFSDAVESAVYTRNIRPKADDIEVFYYPADHNGHNEYIEYIRWIYNKSTPNTIVDHYTMYLFDTKDMNTPIVQGYSDNEKVWYQDIKDYLDEDNNYIPRGHNFAYGVRVYDQYDEFSDIKLGKTLMRNQKPEIPTNIKVNDPNPDNEIYMFGENKIVWDKGIDPDNGDTDTLVYDVQISTDKMFWDDIAIDLKDTKIVTTELNDMLDPYATKAWIRVRAKDEHNVYSDWGYASPTTGFTIIRLPEKPSVALFFENNSSIKFGSNLYDTYCYYKITGADANGFETVVNNIGHITYTNGTGTRSIKLYLQYYESATWKDINFDQALKSNLVGHNFNEWINITTFKYSGTTEQIKQVSLQYAEKRKFRVFIVASAMKSGQNEINSVSSDIIEFSVNLVPTMDENQIRLVNKYVGQITDNYMDLKWEESEDPKDIMLRSYRIRYCIGDYGKHYGNYSIANVLLSDYNSLEQEISMHTLGVPENSWLKMQIQPGDDLEWNYESWYGKDLELLHNTPPKFRDGMTITSDQDNDHIFKDLVTFYLPYIEDPEDDMQDLVYQIQRFIGGQWLNYDLAYPHNPESEGDANNDKTRITIDCDYLVDHTFGAELKFRIRAFDGIEYSDWLESDSYFRNIPPYGIMQIEYDPLYHLNYDDNHNALQHHEYIDCCYWNFTSQNTLTAGLPYDNIKGYKVWLLTAMDKKLLENFSINSTSNIVDFSGLLSVEMIATNPNYNVDLVRYEWARGIADINRGDYYKYIVQVEDIYGETSVPYNGPIYYRNRAPLAPTYVKVLNTVGVGNKEVCIKTLIEFDAGNDPDFDKLRYQLEYCISYDGVNYGIPDTDDNIAVGNWNVLVGFDKNELLDNSDERTFKFTQMLVDTDLNPLIKEGCKIKYRVCAVDEHDVESNYRESEIYLVHIQPRGAILKYPGLFVGINDPMPIVYNPQCRLLLEMNKDINDYYIDLFSKPIDTGLELIITHKYKVEETDEDGNTIIVDMAEEFRSKDNAGFFNTLEYDDGDKAKFKCFNELKLGENVIEVKTFDGIQDSKINAYKIELRKPIQAYLDPKDYTIIWNSISENIKTMIVDIYNSYGECEHYNNGEGYLYDIDDYEMTFGVEKIVVPEGYNNEAWNCKKINDFINNYCDGFEYRYNDVFFVSYEDFTLSEQINLLLERLLNM